MPKAMRHARMPSQANTNVRSFWPGGGAEIPNMKWNPRNIFARNWIMAPLRRCAAMAGAQYDIGPTSFSTSAISTMTMASHGQPSRKQPSGPLLRHFLQPMQRIGSIWMRPNGGLSSSGTQNMQSSTGQYSTQAGDPAHPVQHSVMTASSFGFFLRAVEIPLERGSNFCSSGTIPGALTTSCSGAMGELYLCFQCFGTHVQRVYRAGVGPCSSRCRSQMAPSRVKYAISKSCVNSSASVGHASSHSPQNMHREVSYVKKVSTLRRVASSRSQPTTIKFSGHASAHKLQPMHSVSPVSGLLFSRGAPRYRSATIGRSSGYCSVTMFLGFCARKVTARPFKKSTWNNRSRSSRMRVVSFATTSLSSNCCTTEIGSRDAGAANWPGSHFAVVQQDRTDQHNAHRPEAPHRISRPIFGRQPQLQPTRPSGRNRQNRQRNMAQFGQRLFLDVSQSVRMCEQQRAGNGHEHGKNKRSEEHTS